ncbi:Aminotransferase class I and II family protein [Aspergillus niger]|uniref:Aminotransferase class I and II family protein n=1 Tax=Aspergillus niger TaxID=5061 RepID=A0A254UFB2_ASPNG|nr:Aminotransferase class I and II family protein [Aspergillus niger]SPB51509.1 unnamed protein product [Aspergillus niger]
MDSMGINEFRIDGDVARSIVESSNDELEELTALYHDSSDDADIELFIFACLVLFRRTYSLQWGEQAYEKAQQWTASTPLGDGQYRRRFRIMTSIKALANTQDIIVGDASLQRTILNDLYNGSRYKETGSVEDLTDTINFRGTLLPRIRPMYKPDAVLGMARWLVLRFEKDEQLYLGDLKSAINMVDALLSAGVPHPFSPAQLLVQVGEWTHKLYDCDQDLGTLDKSIETYRHALRLSLGKAELRIRICLELADALLVRAVKTANPAGFVEPTTTLAGLLEEPSLGDFNRSTVLSSLAVSVLTYFQLSGDVRDLIRSIGYMEMALSCPSYKASPRVAPIEHLIGTLTPLIENLEKLPCYDVVRLLLIPLEQLCGPNFPQHC